jgi:hypothetical protein
MLTPASAGTFMRSTFLAYRFVSRIDRFYRPFGFSLHSQLPFCFGTGCFLALARCGFHNRSNLLPARLKLPFGTFKSLRIEHSNRLASGSPPSVSARFRSLPATVSITSLGCGSPFPARYALGGLLFLKPLGTTFTMQPNPAFGQRFLVCNRPVFNSIYFSCFDMVTGKPRWMSCA